MASKKFALRHGRSHETRDKLPIARIALLGLCCLGVAWGCGSSSDGDGGGSPDASAGSPGAGGSSNGGTGGGTAGTSGAGGNPGAGAAGGGTAGVGGGTAGAGATGGSGVGGSGVDAGVPRCDPLTLECRPGLCAEANSPCSTSTDCCTLRCEGGSCQAAQCVGDNDTCTSGEQCCSGTCSGGGTCTPLNVDCKTSGNGCAADAECCSKYCKNGTCDIAPSWCIQTGDLCNYAEDCCSGSCVIAQGNTSGTCGEPPGGSGCNGKAIEGSVCAGFNDCATCCSKLCAPNAVSGVFVCQPTSGCRTEGGLCRVDTDCCGVAGTGLPGDGQGVCEREPGSAIGICKTNSCIPQGQVCHYDGALYVCDSGTSDPNSCCGATGSSGRCIAGTDGVLRCNGFEGCPAGAQADDPCSLCMLDPLGIPRCNGLAACRQAGETCSNSGDCCDQLPCIPDESGVLRCLPIGTCVEEAGTCTVDADCCVGLTCIKPPGSISGTCGTIVVTPQPDAGTPPPDSGTQPPGPCAAYGQDCTASSQCCNYDPVAFPDFGCFDGICKVTPG